MRAMPGDPDGWVPCSWPRNITHSSSCCYKHTYCKEAGGRGVCEGDVEGPEWCAWLPVSLMPSPNAFVLSIISVWLWTLLLCLRSSQPVTFSSSVYTSFLSLTRPVMLRHDVMGLGLLQGREPRRGGSNQDLPSALPPWREGLFLSQRHVLIS